MFFKNEVIFRRNFMKTAIKEITSTDSFRFSFDGKNEIEAALLGRTLSNISFIVSQIVEDEPTKPEYSLKVKTFKKGSFCIEFGFALIALGQATQMAGISSLEQAANLFTIITGMLDIKSRLKGEKPKSVNEDLNNGHVQVIASDGTEVIAPLGSRIVITNPQVEKSISELAENARLHNPNGGIKLIRGQEEHVYNQEQIQDISLTTHDVEYKNTSTTREQRVALPIKKPDLLGNGAWTFKYGNRAITASINDSQFMTSVHNGTTSYKAGDKLDVDLIMDIKLSPDNTPIGETFSIEKVYGIIPSPRQTKL